MSAPRIDSKIAADSDDFARGRRIIARLLKAA